MLLVVVGVSVCVPVYVLRETRTSSPVEGEGLALCILSVRIRDSETWFFNSEDATTVTRMVDRAGETIMQRLLCFAVCGVLDRMLESLVYGW